MGIKVALHNLGCKVNAYEVEAMQQLLEEAGYEIVPFEPGADVYLINTCFCGKNGCLTHFLSKFI